MTPFPPILRRVYWETTAACNLNCIHCRRTDVLGERSPEELTTAQANELIDELASMGKPTLIFSGGEPLYRKDIFTVARYAAGRGLPLALATNGTLVEPEIANEIKKTGIAHVSVSLDGAAARTHDAMRGDGNWERALRGFANLKSAGVKVQINFTVTRGNVGELEDVYRLAKERGAYALFLFLLVPVGCGVSIAPTQMLTAEEVEHWLSWIVKKNREGSLPIKPICAPHYHRLDEQTAVDHTGKGKPGSTSRKGCLAGVTMCFISHKGDVFPCGYLPYPCGNILKTSLKKIWTDVDLLQKFRDPAKLGGRCGLCEFKQVCGGCRARAYHAFQDPLAEEPYCLYQPPHDKAKK